MGNEDTFNGAVAAMAFLSAYENTVADELGQDRMLGMLTKMCEAMGSMQGTMMKSQSGNQEIDAKAAWSMVKSVPESLGIPLEVVKEGPNEVVTKLGRCPVYAAGEMLGVDPKAIETRCRRGSEKVMNAMTEQLNPNLRYELRKFRSSADDFCEEAIVKK